MTAHTQPPQHQDNKPNHTQPQETYHPPTIGIHTTHRSTEKFRNSYEFGNVGPS